MRFDAMNIQRIKQHKSIIINQINFILSNDIHIRLCSICKRWSLVHLQTWSEVAWSMLDHYYKKGIEPLSNLHFSKRLLHPKHHPALFSLCKCICTHTRFPSRRNMDNSCTQKQEFRLHPQLKSMTACCHTTDKSEWAFSVIIIKCIMAYFNSMQGENYTRKTYVYINI